MGQATAELEVQTAPEQAKVHQEMDNNVIEHEALDALQDLYCALREKCDPTLAKAKIMEKELKTVEDALQLELDKHYSKTEPVVRTTDKYMLECSARGKARVLTSKDKLIHHLGIDTFKKVADVSISDMEKYLTPQQLDEVLETVNKNKRKLNWANA